MERLDSLVGFNSAVVQKLYHNRTQWIHKAKDVEKDSVRLAIYCSIRTMLDLVHFATICPANTKFTSLLQWLDLTSFVRGRHSEKPFELRKLYEHFKDLNPFSIAEDRTAVLTTVFFVTTNSVAYFPSWKYSKKCVRAFLLDQVLKEKHPWTLNYRKLSWNLLTVNGAKSVARKK